jgi:hypothetical protein
MHRKIPQARMAIERFIGDLNPRDDIFLLGFSSRIFLLQPCTMNHSQVMDRLVLLRDEEIGNHLRNVPNEVVSGPLDLSFGESCFSPVAMSPNDRDPANESKELK